MYNLIWTIIIVFNIYIYEISINKYYYYSDYILIYNDWYGEGMERVWRAESSD